LHNDVVDLNYYDSVKLVEGRAHKKLFAAWQEKASRRLTNQTHRRVFTSLDAVASVQCDQKATRREKRAAVKQKARALRTNLCSLENNFGSMHQPRVLSVVSKKENHSFKLL
jgi:hypothetical protein